MKVFFPNSAWVKTRERLVLKGGRFAKIDLKVRYGVIIHPKLGPILIDTGYTEEVISGTKRGVMLDLYARVLRPRLNKAEQPKAVLARMGYGPEDVRYVIVTHFHADHVSGLGLFPNAQFIVDGAAYKHLRSTPRRGNLRHGIFTELLPDNFSERVIELCHLPEADPGYGLPVGHDIFGDGCAVAVSLEGHAKGQFGILMTLNGSPLLYAVDVQWLACALTEDRIPGWPSRLVADDFTAYKHSAAIVADYIKQGHTAVFCHDPETSAYDYLPETIAK